jgi:hypothetical protein
MNAHPYHRESGNIFFYIFLGVALFGALTLAVSQGGRVSSSNLTREQMQLRATEIIDYSDTISKAVGTLRLRGVTLANLRFATPALSVTDYGDSTAIDQVNLVFHPNGGSAIYREAGAASVNAGNGPYFDGLGRCARRYLPRNQHLCQHRRCHQRVTSRFRLPDDRKIPRHDYRVCRNFRR